MQEGQAAELFTGERLSSPSGCPVVGDEDCIREAGERFPDHDRDIPVYPFLHIILLNAIEN